MSDDTPSDYSDISPGVRDLVRDLNAHGYRTTDSGDGTNHRNGMGCAIPCRHVFGVLEDGADLRAEADRLKALYPDARIEVSYSPGEPAVFMLFPDGGVADAE